MTPQQMMEEIDRLTRLCEAKDAVLSSEWIPVEDKLPESSGAYLVLLKHRGKYHGREIDTYFEPINLPGKMRWHIEFRGTQGLTVSHWMPLPPIPRI